MSGRSVAVFGSSTTPPGSDAWRDAERFGRRLAAAGWTVRTGGYGGSMEAVSAGARAALDARTAAGDGAPAGAVIGVTAPALFPDRSGANEHLTEEIAARTLLGRIDAMLAGVDACVALPGALGTFTEIMAAWNVIYLERRLGRPAPPLIAVGARWRELIAAVAAATGADRGGVRTVASADEAAAWLGRLEPPS